MSANPEELRDAESAVTTVASRVRQDTLTTERKKYSLALERFENDQFGAGKKTAKPKNDRQNKEPQAGPSNGNGGRTFKQAKRFTGQKNPRNNKGTDKALSNLLSLLMRNK